MVIFIESIIFADVQGYIYEKFVKTFSYIYIFSYNFINETFVSKVIDKFNTKTATGVDKISVKLMKLGKISLLSPITRRAPPPKIRKKYDFLA
jgi:hypothetical protein